jgi:hypothetical protein
VLLLINQNAGSRSFGNYTPYKTIIMQIKPSINLNGFFIALRPTIPKFIINNIIDMKEARFADKTVSRHVWPRFMTADIFYDQLCDSLALVKASVNSNFIYFARTISIRAPSLELPMVFLKVIDY